MSKYHWVLTSALDVENEEYMSEVSRITTLMEKAGKNPMIQREQLALYMTTVTAGQCFLLFAIFPFAWNEGRLATHADIHQGLVLMRNEWNPILKQAVDQNVGPRKEFYSCLKNISIHIIGGHAVSHVDGSSEKNMQSHSFGVSRSPAMARVRTRNACTLSPRQSGGKTTQALSSPFALSHLSGTMQ